MDNPTHSYIDSNLAGFHQDVIEASSTQLVLVDFWAAWCGPCRSLAPILEKLTAEYAGSVKLVKVDTDAEQELASQFGIRSLPTVFLFKNGEIVDQFMGVESEAVIRAKINKYAVSQLDQNLQAAELEYQQGNIESAKKVVWKLVEEHPKNDHPKLLLMKWLSGEKSFEEAFKIAESVSQPGQSTPEYRALSATLEFQQGSQVTTDTASLMQSVDLDPENLEIRYQLAQRLISEQQYSEGMDHLLEIIKRNRQFHDDAARKTILKVFEALGGHGDLVSEYRSKLSSLLF